METTTTETNSPHYKKFYKSKLLWGIAVALFILAPMAVFSYFHLFNKNLVTASIKVPGTTPLADELKPDNLTINFSKSVAPIAEVGKNVTQGISITPKTTGTWSWQDDTNLIFVPDTDWPAHQEYTIQFTKKVFSPGSKLKNYTLQFTTNPFTIGIADLSFYSSPVDPDVKQVTATISFNYPVNPASLENNLKLELQTLDKNNMPTGAQSLAFKITYDKFKRSAYITSENITLTAIPRYAKLTIAKQIQALKGPGTSGNATSKSVLVPDVASYFKVSNITADIMRNAQNRPEQILHLETTLGINESELNSKLHVFLLPKDLPATAMEPAKTNYQWQSAEEATPEILKNSTPVTLQAIPAEHDYSALHSYKFTAPESRYMYVKLEDGVKGFGGYLLKNSYATIVKVPEFPKEISFLHEGSLLALNSEQKISVLARGIPAIKFRIARVLPDDVNHLITQTNGNFSDPKFANYRFTENNISEIFSEVKQFANADAAKELYTAVDLAKYLAVKTNPNGPLGLFLLQAQGWDPDKKEELPVNANRLILITDLGIVVKNNVDDSHDIFVGSITRGSPVANAQIAVLGKNGLPIVTKTTDANGHINIPSLNDFTKEQQPTVYLAKNNNDVAFIPYSNSDRALNYSKYDTGGLYTNNTNEGIQDLTAFVFTERGIYRPGNTVHIAAIVRGLFAANAVAGLPLEINIISPTGTTIWKQKTTLSDLGYLTYDFPTSATTPTGQYDIMVYLNKDNLNRSLLGSTSTQIQEFLPDRLKIQAALVPKATHGWLAPQGIKGNISLWNLFGAPAINHRITGKIVLTPQAIHFDDYPNYIFADPLLDPKKPPQTVTETLSEMRTNDQGNVEYELNLEKFPHATYKLSLFAEGFEAEGGRSVTTQTSVLISPLDYLVGYKANDDLSYIPRNANRSLNLIAIDRNLSAKSLSNLKAQLFILKPVVSLVKLPNGTYQYQSLMQENLISEAPLSIPEQGTNFAFNTSQLGDFKIVIVNAEGVKVSQVNYSVVGLGEQALPKNAELKVKLNKSEYLPGEEIELQINSPYVGSGLITIERDKTYAYHWFKTDAKSSLQKITLPQDFQGNGYINVAFVRDWNSPEIFMNPLSYCVVPFAVSKAQHAVNIQLETRKSARPGEVLEINYKTDKPGKIIVFAVDEGILQVSAYQTPEPLDFFFQKRALEVDTQQILDLILPKFIAARELSAVGGDGGRRKMEISNLNPFKRKSEAPVVYWSGIVDADQTNRTLFYNVPDYFNGTLKIMAVAVASNAVGSAEKTSTICGDFVINPNVPTFVAPGDVFTVTAGITSNLKNSENSPVNVHLTISSQLEILGEQTQTLTIGEKQEKIATFKLKAHDSLGDVDLNFEVKSASTKAAMHSSLSIRPLMPLNTTVTSGYSDKIKTLTVDRKLYPEFREVEATVATSPLILVAGLNKYLDGYPYGCTEQLVSKGWPLLAMHNQPLFKTEQSALNKKVSLIIQLLRERQLSNGGFIYWPGVDVNANDDTPEFASIYALHFLTEARAHGFAVPLDMLNSGISYLKDIAAANVENLTDARLQAYAIYVLTRNEIVTTNYLTHLQDYLEQHLSTTWQKDITSAYIAATYQLLKNTSVGEKFIDYFQPMQQQNTESTWYYNDDIANAQYLLLLAEHFPNTLTKQINKLLLPLANKLNVDYISTVFAGYASIALGSVDQAWQQNNPSVELSIKEFNTNNQVTNSGQGSSFKKLTISPQTAKIEFSTSGKPGFFYQLLQTGFDRTPPTQEIKSGLEVYREYIVNNTPITSAELGQEIEVHIKLRSISDDTLDNIAIVDLLPGGFEVVRESLKAQDYDYLDIREDRVIFFTSLSKNTKEIVYRIRATNNGEFAIPPAFAAAMYQPKIQAVGLAGKISIVSK